MATLKDVAQEAGLTVTTVSRVLNNRGYISENARASVYNAMEKLNYSPNEVARLLSKKTSNTIGVIVPHIRHPYFSSLISHIESHASKHNYKILLCNSRDRNEKEIEFLQMYEGNRVAGVILCSGSVELNAFAGTTFPIVTIERNFEKSSVSIECDNSQGGKLAANHLIEAGCKNILIFGVVNQVVMPADERIMAFKTVCEQKGINYKETITTKEQYDTIDYYSGIEKELLQNEEIDGIFASSDIIAAQVLQVCYKLNKKVPQDIKVMGFDDVYIASLTTPTLATISQPLKEMAKNAVESIVSLNKGKVVPVKVILPVTLKKGQSTETL